MKTLHVAKPIHRSPLRRALLLIGPALVVIAALTAVSARATPQSGVTSVTIANGTFADIDVYAKTDINPSPDITDFWKARIDTKGASHLYILQNTVIPGGTFGWHSHTGPSLVIVVSGTATEYEGNDPTCTPHVHPAGSTFADPGEASGHLVRNEGSVNLVVVVVRLVPEALVLTQRIDLPNPGYWPNIN
jgi:quercetin dioxygenase-like cupin family protein